MQYLKADTNTEVLIGPVVAVGDGFTPITNLSPATADEAELIKHNGASGLVVTDISGSTMTAITDADGYYTLDISTGNADTEGFLTVLFNDDSLCLPVRHDFMVVNANVYDSLFAAATTDYLQTDTVSIAANAITATAINADAITSAKIADNAIGADQIAANAIGASEIADAAIDAATFAANAITSTVVADNTITAAKINADAITSAKIADNALANEHFAAGALTSTEITSAAGCAVASIAANAVDASAIADNAIDAGAIAANAITSTEIADGAITAAKLGADCITAAKIGDDAIAAEHIASGAIVAATFGANAITSTVVADNTITAAKINADAITNAKIADDAIGAENLATDALSADALAAGAVTEIQSGLATASNVTDAHSTTDGLITTVDGVADAIKVVTDNLAASATTLVTGTVSWDNTNASRTIFYSSDITTAAADHYNGRIVIFTSGALQNQATDITDYALVSSEGQFTVTELTDEPADNVTFVIV